MILFHYFSIQANTTCCKFILDITIVWIFRYFLLTLQYHNKDSLLCVKLFDIKVLQLLSLYQSFFIIQTLISISLHTYIPSIIYIGKYIYFCLQVLGFLQRAIFSHFCCDHSFWFFPQISRICHSSHLQIFTGFPIRFSPFAAVTSS